MGISNRIKQNRFLRVFHVLYRAYFGNCKRSRFGYLADTAKLILRRLYNNYMELPPLEKQRIHCDNVFSE